jgi:predicted nucleic-acid-binding Zn-ribbon protein
MSNVQAIQSRIISFLTIKLGTTPKCPLCGNTEWTVNDHYFALSLSSHPSQLQLNGPMQPTIPIICSNCGNTHLINLLVLGFKQEELDSLRFIADARPN